MNEWYLLFIPALICSAHLVGSIYNIKSRKYAAILRSLTAGFSVAYVFVVLLPEINRFNRYEQFDPMVLVVLGFVLFHSAHKYIFRASEPPIETFLLDETHILTAGIYNFLITFLLVQITRSDILQGLVIAVLFSLHAILVDLAHAEPIRAEHKKNKLIVIIVSVLLGGMISVFDVVSSALTGAVYAMTVGALIYISIREEIPSENRSNPIWFIVGSTIPPVVLSLLL